MQGVYRSIRGLALYVVMITYVMITYGAKSSMPMYKDE